jgi:hypothetical protein
LIQLTIWQKKSHFNLAIIFRKITKNSIRSLTQAKTKRSLT